MVERNRISKMRRWGERSTRQARVFTRRNARSVALLNTSSRLVEWFRDTRQRAWPASESAGRGEATWCRRRERKEARGEAKNAEPNRAGYRCIGRRLSRIRARSTLEEFFFPLSCSPVLCSPYNTARTSIRDNGYLLLTAFDSLHARASALSFVRE